MGRPRIFVSHSNADKDSLKYIDAIDAALGVAGFDVLVDRKRLVPGTKWRDDIYTWLGLCHAAVVLVSEAAIQPGSIWVPRETSILLWRLALDSKFILVPACLGTVTPQDLKGGVFADMQLAEVLTAPAATPEQLVAALCERFASLAAPKTPLEVLASRLAEILQPVSQGAIEEAIDALAIDLGPCMPAGDPRRALALALLQVPLRDSLSAMEVLAEYVEGSKADLILSIIAPSWVDLCAARWLAHCGARLENKSVLVLNATTSFCAQMYVDRASGRPPKTRWPIVHSTGVHGERVAQEIAAEIEQNLIHEFRLFDDPLMPDPSARLAALLSERQREGRPVFAALRFSPAIASVLSEVQRLLPSVTFLLLSGDDFPDLPQTRTRPFQLIEPRLQPGAEAKALLDFDYVRSIIRRQAGVA